MNPAGNRALNRARPWNLNRCRCAGDDTCMSCFWSILREIAGLPQAVDRRPLFVGELDPTGNAHRSALSLRSSSGKRLRKILGLTVEQYVEKTMRWNLCAGRWNPVAARKEAKAVVEQCADRAIVLLGREVCGAFGVTFRPFEQIRIRDEPTVILPHPSGKCHVWNDPSSVEEARRVLERSGVAARIRWINPLSVRRGSNG